MILITNHGRDIDRKWENCTKIEKIEQKLRKLNKNDSQWPKMVLYPFLQLSVEWTERKLTSSFVSASETGLLQNQAVLTTVHPDCRHVKYGNMWYCPSGHIAIIFRSSLNFGGGKCTVPFVTYQHLVQPRSFKRNLGNASKSLVTHFVGARKKKKCERVNFTSKLTPNPSK